ncbi:hypothetical protein [Streptomyces sp. NBC_00035]|uniref:hypothetical protein n=1 Tax=Streptomyces sp. NBC_00035 TaxID=2903614 RepID=UPI0032548A5D
MKALTFPIGEPFRLHLPHQVLDGWHLADGQALVIDDPEYGLASAAPTVADLVRGYGCGRIEWPDHDPEQHDQQERGAP